jgi:hypothetical protein
MRLEEYIVNINDQRDDEVVKKAQSKMSKKKSSDFKKHRHNKSDAPKFEGSKKLVKNRENMSRQESLKRLLVDESIEDDENFPKSQLKTFETMDKVLLSIKSVHNPNSHKMKRSMSDIKLLHKIYNFVPRSGTSHLDFGRPNGPEAIGNMMYPISNKLNLNFHPTLLGDSTFEHTMKSFRHLDTVINYEEEKLNQTGRTELIKSTFDDYNRKVVLPGAHLGLGKGGPSRSMASLPQIHKSSSSKLNQTGTKFLPRNIGSSD